MEKSKAAINFNNILVDEKLAQSTKAMLRSFGAPVLGISTVQRPTPLPDRQQKLRSG